MTREHTVEVRLKAGAGAVTHCAGHQYHISIQPGEVLSKWGDGSPITRREFDSILAAIELFEIVNHETEAAAQEGGDSQTEEK